jgi:predicted DCC family thiol-disulfide oxidoreductase YuxK
MAIVIYDGDCGFCRWCLAVLLRADRDGALRPLPLGSAGADDLLADLSPEERVASWHLILDPEETQAARVADASGPTRFSAGAALAPALSLLRDGRIPAALFARFPRATERGYRWVADHRGLLGRFVPARARRWADRVIAAHGGPARPQ